MKTPHIRRVRGVVASLVAILALLAIPSATTVAREPRKLDWPPVGERVRAISAGEADPGQYCAIRPDRSLACWTDHTWSYVTEDGTLTVEIDEDAERREVLRPPRGEFFAVSVGADHGCGIRTNHKIACWGDDQFRTAWATPPKGDFIAIAAGWESTCAIRTDQTVACWGDGPGARPPSGTFTSLDAGQDIYCGLRTDRTAACWGGSPDVGIDTAPQPPPEEFTDVAIYSWFRGCGIRPDSTVACWGAADERDWLNTVASQFGRVLAVGDDCAIRIDGTLVCLGRVEEGGVETFPGPFTALSGICAIRADETLFCVDFIPLPPQTDTAAPPATHTVTQTATDTHPAPGLRLAWLLVLVVAGALGAGSMLARLRQTAR
jgi:hypothetical protein